MQAQPVLCRPGAGTAAPQNVIGFRRPCHDPLQAEFQRLEAVWRQCAAPTPTGDAAGAGRASLPAGWWLDWAAVAAIGVLTVLCCIPG
ncbi:hypothetical protein [Frigidibacter oleivorans]|uniref:hypothetical protein n=1 Tax=Frigidibacter oleivorans TaxID=2487129 RepID=UPI000F8ED999|nr:hypothetical protein [Frigidibacter oleivorans]